MKGTPDVFISYAREDQELAKALRDLLADEGWEVWWDDEIVVGERWARALEQALDRARVVLVLWTEHSVRSRWVRKEAAYAREGGKLLSAKVRRCRVPAAFLEQEMAMLTGWDRQVEHPELQQLFRGLAGRVPPSRIDVVRPGFVPAFLGKGFAVGWPSVPGTAQRLHYLHFTSVMNPARRLAWYVAYNVSGRARVAVPRGQDRWLADPLVVHELQPSNALYTQGEYHRGHLVSSSLVAWGKRRHAEIARHQAFFWTNTAPQHQHVNTRTYLAIEDWERGLGRRMGRFCAFAGPALDAGDPVYRGEETQPDGFAMRQTFRMPQAYWKVVAVASGRPKRLRYAAFMVDNRADGGGRDPWAFSVDIAEIERRTQIGFPDVLREAARLKDGD